MTDARAAEALLSTGRILRRTVDLLRGNAVRAGIVLVVLAVPGIVADARLVGPEGERGLILVNSIISLAMQLWLTKVLLQELGWDRRSGVAFWAFFGLVLISSVAILIGMIFLVVPGVILFVRWSISVPILLGSDEGVIGSMRRSWRETENRFWPILGAFMAVYLPALVLVAGGFLLEGSVMSPLAVAILANLVLQAALIGGWHAAVAIYALVAGPGALSRVFD